MKKGGRFVFLKIVGLFVICMVCLGLIFYEQLPNILRPEIAKKLFDFYEKNPLTKSILSTIRTVLISIIPLIILAIILKVFVFSNKKEIVGIIVPEVKSKSKTQLDALYKVVQEKKELKVSSISKLFSIDQELAMDWAKILESGDLVQIEYPDLGGPIVKLKEEEIEEVAEPKVKKENEKIVEKNEKKLKKKEEKEQKKLSAKEKKLEKKITKENKKLEKKK